MAVFQPGYGLPVYRTTRSRDPPFCFSAARDVALLTNYPPSRAAEKQKEKVCVGIAFYKQSTTNLVETPKREFA